MGAVGATAAGGSGVLAVSRRLRLTMVRLLVVSKMTRRHAVRVRQSGNLILRSNRVRAKQLLAERSVLSLKTRGPDVQSINVAMKPRVVAGEVIEDHLGAFICSLVSMLRRTRLPAAPQRTKNSQSRVSFT